MVKKGEKGVKICYTNSDPDGTLVGNKGLAQARLCKQLQAKPNHLRGGQFLQSSGKTKVGGNANFVLIHNVCFAG